MVDPELTVDDESKYNPASVDPALENEEDKDKKPAIGGPRLQQGEDLSHAPEPAGSTGERAPHGQDLSPNILAAFVNVCVWEQNIKARIVEGTPPGADEVKRWQKAKIAVLKATLASALATALGPTGHCKYF
ncbi:hypothetical protein QFC21_005288 [Naganishia friedmannii]|uniref:Uncharacterized protein n=1 Tax=Naganishia friedmannii TaxID=89922 RepID=A0ACC2VCA0_9TREE|nr:hypothetical protein QFC21_005288 [Naganishia friedmannii]